jgi:hypothetical protein
VDLQADFSLNHTLSLYLIDTIKLLDPVHPDYALDLLTLVESILENPDLILRKQLDRIKTEKMDEMKFAGVEYDERIAELEKLEYPKPNRDFIYDTFNDFSASHPWVGQENIRPKSIAREMYENFQSFSEYIRDYGLQRAEGLLLRYLSDVYKALVQTVPEAARNEEIEAVAVYLGSMLRQIDSSLLDEWERLKNPNWVAPEIAEEAPTAASTDIVRNKKNFTILVRNEVFHFLRAIAAQDYEAALGLIQPSDWTPDRLKATMEAYYSTDHTKICTDPNARNPKNTLIVPDEKAKQWQVQQILVDPDGHNDWAISLNIDLALSSQNSKVEMTLVQIAGL